jgi:hypothetical protein
MSSIITSLERIVKCQNAYYQNLAYLPLGLTGEQKQILLDGFPFKLPKELSDLFDYHIESINFEPEIAIFLSLERSLAESLSYLRDEIPSEILNKLTIDLKYFRGCFKNKIYQQTLENFPHDSCWFPIAQGCCKSTYYTMCNKDMTDKSPVWVKFVGENPIEYADSLTNLMATFAECYEEGAFYPKFELYDPELGIGDWVIEKDIERVESIFEKYNPNHIDNWRGIWGQ